MDSLIEALKAVADETRLAILELLLTRRICVGAIARQLGLSEAAISQHLQVLRRAGLVRGEKQGYWTHYTVERDILRQLAAQLEQMAGRLPRAGNGCPRSGATAGEPGKCTCSQAKTQAAGPENEETRGGR